MTTPSTTPRRPHQPASPTDRPPQGETLPVMSEGSAPRLPHERDESSSSQGSAPREVIEQASKDIARGIQDSDLGPPMDDTYERAFRKDKANRPPIRSKG